MSRTNQTNNKLKPCRSSSSSSSELESTSVHQNFFTFNFTFNYSTPPPEQPSIETFTNLIGQQINDIVQNTKASRRRRSGTHRSFMRPSKEAVFPPEVDAPPLTTESDFSTEDVTQEEREQGESIGIPLMSSLKKSKYSREYIDLSSIKDPSVSYRLVPSKNVKAVPEDQLPKKKYCSNQKRREYVVLGRLNSIEPIEEKDEKTKEEERKKRSRELANELY